MSNASTNVILRHIRRVAAGEQFNGLSDGALLSRYTAQRTEAAFEAIVERHGALVWSVCRRALSRRHDAEDAFQATFLTLADKAHSVRKPEALACWLHGVAHRIAVSMRRRASSAPLVAEPPQAPASNPLDVITGRELCTALDEELAQLPGAYRAALVLCYLEGQTRDEAARQLNWSVSTLKRRLRVGCRLLRGRLSRRGLAPSAILLTAAVTHQGAAAVLPLLRGKVRAALPISRAERGAAATLAPLGWAFGTRGRVALALLLVSAMGLGMGAAGSGGPQIADCRLQIGRSTNWIFRFPFCNLQSAICNPSVDPLPPGAVARLGSARWRHGGDVYGLAYSPDGKLLASGSVDGRVCLWHTATGKLVRDFAPLNHGLVALAFSPDGKRLAATCAGGEGVHVWDVATGAVTDRADFAGTAVRAAGYRRDGVLVAANWTARTVQLSDSARDGRRGFRDLTGHEAKVVFVGLAADGDTLISADQSGTVRLWQVATGKPLRTLRLPGEPLTQGDIGFTLSPDGKVLGAATPRRSLILWDVTAGKELRRLSFGDSRFTALAFAPDGRTLAAGSSDNTIRRWDVPTGKELPQPDGHRRGVRAAVLSPDGKTVISAGGDSTVRFWDVASGRQTRQLMGKTTPRPLASFLDPDTGKVIRQFERTPWILSLGRTRDGKLLAGGGSDGVVIVWDAATGRALHRLAGHRREVRALAFTPDDKTLLAGSEDGMLRLWDVRTGKERRRIETQQGQGIGVAVSADGRMLASMGWDGQWTGPVNTIRFWDLDGKEVGRLSEALGSVLPVPDPQRIYTAAFSPDGRLLATLGFDGAVRTWNLATAKQMRVWPRNPALVEVPTRKTDGILSMSAVDPLVFSPDGRVLALSWGHSVVLYEVATGKLRRQFHGHRGPITSLSFSAAGRLLASGCGDCTTLVWDVGAEKRDRE